MGNLTPPVVLSKAALAVLLLVSAMAISNSQAIEAEVVTSLPFSTEGNAPTQDDPDFFSFTPNEDMEALIDTCGTGDIDEGFDTVLRLYKRVVGANSDTDISLSDFELLEENDDNWPPKCSALTGKPGSNIDSILMMDLTANVQYLISVTPDENYNYEGHYQLSIVSYVVPPPPSPQPPQPPQPPIPGLDVTIIESLPFQVQNKEIVYSDFDWYSFTPTKNTSALVDTCGTYQSNDGIDTNLFVWKRVKGENSDTYIKQGDFWFIAVKSGGGNQCNNLAGKDGSFPDVVFEITFFENIQYLIRVSIFDSYAGDSGVYDLSVIDWDSPLAPSPPPLSPPAQSSTPISQTPLADVFVIDSLPFSAQGLKSFISEDEWFTFTSTESVSVLIDTCGSQDLSNGLSTSLIAFERMKGANSNTDIKLGDFTQITDQFNPGPFCSDLAGKPGSIFDSVATLQLTENLQYLVLVSKYGYVPATGGFYNLAVAEYSLPSPSLPESPPLQLPPSVLLGDMNGDGMVNVGDTITLAEFIFNGLPDGFPFSSADLKMDGVLNVLDIVELVNIIVGL